MRELFEIFSDIDWTTIIIGAVIGAFIPVVIKFVVSLFKSHKEKYHISPVCKESNTYKSMTNGDVSICIHYKDEIYDGSLSVMEIGLINDGLNDISFANHFDKPILLRSSDYQIIDVQNISDPKIKSSLSLNEENRVLISWELLKQNESVLIRLVGKPKEVEGNLKKKSNSFYDSLSFSVRSDCVDYIAPRRISFARCAVLSFLIIAIIGGICAGVVYKKQTLPERYTFSYEGQVFSGSLELDEESGIYIVNSADSSNHRFGMWDFKRYPYVKIAEEQNGLTSVILVFFCLWIIFLLMSVLIVVSQNKEINNKKIFED